MVQQKNSLDQPVSFPVESWQSCKHPRGSRLQGRLCRLEPVDRALHAADLFDAFEHDSEQRNWTYLPYGPFDGLPQFQAWLERTCLGDDPCFLVIIDLRSGKAVGIASYLRINPAVGVIEVGHIHLSPLMQARPIATEAMYLMMAHVFD